MDERTSFHKDVFGRIPEEKQARVLSFAVREFAAKGLSGANINVIAEEAGISVGSMYKYFESKTDLYLEVVHRGMSIIQDSLDPILNSDLDFETKIDGIIEAIFIGAREYPRMNKLYSRYTAEIDKDLARSLSSRLESITAGVYAVLLRQAMDEGLVENAEDERLSAFFMDNIFLTLQFSLTDGYWGNRMQIFLGDDILDREAQLKSFASGFLKRALGIM